MPPSAAPQSMTGFASGNLETPAGRVTVELRSVNNRFLDLAMRLPDELRAVEPALRELIAARVRRGKVECRIAQQRPAGSAGETAAPDGAASVSPSSPANESRHDCHERTDRADDRSEPPGAR